MRSALIKAVILALSVVATSRVFAADAVDEARRERLKNDTKAVGREWAREGERIADEAVDIADNFVDAYEKTKDDLRDR